MKDCHANQFTCSNGQCIDLAKKCDQTYDCVDASDETNCIQCTSDQFACQDKTCINGTFLCDGKIDCKDGSDEYSCKASGKLLN